MLRFLYLCTYSYRITFRVTEGCEPLLSLLNKARLTSATKVELYKIKTEMFRLAFDAQLTFFLTSFKFYLN